MKLTCRECGQQWECRTNPTLLCPDCQRRLGPGDGDEYLDDEEADDSYDDAFDGIEAHWGD